MPNNQDTILEADKMHRESNMAAMKTTGWKRSVHLWFARFFDMIGREMREIEADKKRGKDDTYHNEY